MPLTERDFAMFEPARAPLPPAKPKQPPVRAVQSPAEESLASKKAREHKVWMQSLVAYAVSGVVALCLFMVVQSETARHRAMVEQRNLFSQLETVQQRNINYQTQIERKYSLELVQNIALQQYHMVPIEGGRVTYLNVLRGDQRLE
jgi:hypothetical protein